ncbi:helix-turn-helix protein [Arcticibacter tournemirensis]|nr:helix-turn-helix domain-containing protein [Arcticibacter tournemirensis]TQM49510.1 helix-turn-helix protein [Arcticibacter tournemirensis]TQM50833.1 helix-turn-helix protein [Arcticibacter tournemirensis]
METRRVKFKSKRAEKNVPFDKRKIKEIVEQIESGIPRREILSEYGMHESTLTNWMTRYGSKDYYAERSRRYSPSEKRSVLRAVESGMSVREACVAFGIKSRTVVDRWVKQQKAENAELSRQIPPVKSKKKQQKEVSAGETKSLKEQLAEAQLKIRALETMIDIAEEQLKIDIRKKSGAKQSPK